MTNYVWEENLLCWQKESIRNTSFHTLKRNSPSYRQEVLGNQKLDFVCTHCTKHLIACVSVRFCCNVLWFAIALIASKLIRMQCDFCLHYTKRILNINRLGHRCNECKVFSTALIRYTSIRFMKHCHIHKGVWANASWSVFKSDFRL